MAGHLQQRERCNEHPHNNTNTALLSVMAAAWLLAAAAALGGGGLLWHERRRQRAELLQADTKAPGVRRRRKQAALAAVLAASPLGASIPDHELAQLAAFLARVHAWRGWASGAYHVRQAWHAAEAAATQPSGGGWRGQFEARELSDAACDALLGVIDDAFFAGRLLGLLGAGKRSDGCSGGAAGAVQRQQVQLPRQAPPPPPPPPQQQQQEQNRQQELPSSLQQQPQQQEHRQPEQPPPAQPQPPNEEPGRLHCRVVQARGANGGWLCYFDTDDNAVYVNAWRWAAKAVSGSQRLNCEGVVCSSRLQLLLHTLAHELVHALVFHLWPAIDAASPAYVSNDRHGPVFHLLNKQLFGHSSDALADVVLLPCAR